MVIGGTPLFFALRLPSMKSTSSGLFSHSLAARSLSWRTASCGRLVDRHPGGEASSGCRRSRRYGRSSRYRRRSGAHRRRACPAPPPRPSPSRRAMPPISTEPVITLAVPSAWMLTVAEDCMPALNQKPAATPRPRLGPVSWRLVMLAVLDRLAGLDETDALVGRAGGLRRALLGGVLDSEVDRIDAALLGQFVDHAFRPRRRRWSRPARGRPRSWAG